MDGICAAISASAISRSRAGIGIPILRCYRLIRSSGFDTAGIFGIGVGYQFNNWLRVDVTGQYRGKSNFHGSDVFVFSNAGVPTPGVDTYHASKSEWLALANGYVDLGTWWCMTPYIGAGVGFSRNTMSNFVDTNTPTLGVALAPAGSKWNFAWALHTGLAYKVNPGLRWSSVIAT